MEAGFCSCDYDDYEPPEFLLARDIKARKQHQCCECGEPIQPGDTYEKVTGKWNGEIGCYKTCLPCSRIRLDFCAPLGRLRETLWEGLQVDYLGEWDDEE